MRARTWSALFITWSLDIPIANCKSSINICWGNEWMLTVCSFRHWNVLSKSPFPELYPQMLRGPLAGGSSLVPVLKGDTIPKVMATSPGGPTQWVINVEITKPGPSSTLRTMLKGHPSFRASCRASGSLCWNCRKSSIPLSAQSCSYPLSFIPFPWCLSQMNPQVKLLWVHLYFRVIQGTQFGDT